MLNVLIIDDDEMFLNLLQDFLRPEEFALRTFSRAEEGLAALRDQLPHVLILDLMLPKYDGVAIYHELRAVPRTTILPVIISTAAPHHTAKMQYLADDPYARVLPKPYRLTTLLAEIREMVGSASNYHSVK